MNARITGIPPGRRGRTAMVRSHNRTKEERDTCQVSLSGLRKGFVCYNNLVSANVAQW